MAKLRISNSKRNLLTSICLAFYFLPESVFSQPAADTKPKEFYKEGFVTGGVDKPRQDSNESYDKYQHQAGKQPNLKSPIVTSPLATSTLTNTPTPSNYKTYKVVALSAIVSTMDAQHLESVLGELKDVAVKYDYPIHNIWAPGDLRALEAAQAKFLPIIARGATVSFSNVPKRYQATLSPTWIIETTEGEFVMEATGPLAENFDELGQFVDIPRKVTEITPIPTPTPELAQDKLEKLGEDVSVSEPGSTGAPVH